MLSAGLAFGAGPGAHAGFAVGISRLFGTLVNGVAVSEITGGRLDSHATTLVIYTLAGAMTGYVVGLLCRAQRQIAAAQAREEVARTLHDGVLQTLAVVERRTDDPALARLAREQERELREWLFGSDGRFSGGDGLGPVLRAVAARFEDTFGARTQVLVAEDLPSLTEEQVEAVAGAVGEALTNAAKLGHAGRVVVYAERADDGGVFCNVKDDGAGFDPAAAREGVGLSRSIRGRMADVGGRVEVDSAPGRGAEVRLWL